MSTEAATVISLATERKQTDIPREACDLDYSTSLERLVEHIHLWHQQSSEHPSLDYIVRQDFRVLRHAMKEADLGYRMAIRRINRMLKSGVHDPMQYLLQEIHGIRVGISVLHRDEVVQLHDHPGASGLQLVLHGKVYIENLDAVENPAGRKLVELKSVRQSVYNAGDVASYSEHEGNIHGFKSLTPVTVMLTVSTGMDRDIKRNTYRPYNGFTSTLETHLAEVVQRDE